MFVRALTLWITVVILMSSFAVPARASKKDAETFFAEGRRLRKAGQCEAALAKFRRALATYPEGLGSLRNIAECQQQLGRYAAARRSWWDLRREVLRSGDPKYAGWDAHAESAHARLADRVARLVVELAGPGRDSQVVVRVDGEEIAADLLGVELERDPGVHTVEVQRGGAVLDAKSIRVEAAGRKVVTLRVPAEASKTSSTPAAPSSLKSSPPPDAGGEPSSVLQTAGFAALGLGLAGAVGTGVSIGIRQAAISDVESVCPDYEQRVCPESASAPKRRGETASLLVNVFAVVTGVGLAAGVTLLVIDATGEEDVAIHLTPMDGGGYASAELRF